MKLVQKFGLVVAASVVSVAAVAAPLDLTPLTDGVDFASVGVALLAIAGALATVYVAIKGIRFVLGMLKAG